LTAFLVDTHALLWFLTDDRRLSADARTIIESPQNVVLVSAACVWEIAIKASLGKVTAPAELPTVLREQGFQPLAITHDDAWAAGRLPLGGHKDPFDRLLAAHAINANLPVISNDAQLDQYGVDRRW
jgi:PIN domain nuclease of toxin-antitoxin system